MVAVQGCRGVDEGWGMSYIAVRARLMRHLRAYSNTKGRVRADSGLEASLLDRVNT